MLRREITYEDWDGEKVTEAFYFNLTKTEIVALETGYEGGLEKTIKRIVETRDTKALIEEFKRIILAAYGVRSDDGKRFVKSDELIEEFKQTAAYDALFMELATNDQAASAFINGVLPKDMATAIAAQAEAELPPPPPSPASPPL